MEKARILVVDDEVDVCSMLVQFFSTSGYDSKYATNGTEAIELMQSFSPHFVFLDVMMPEMSGIEVLKEIRDIDKTVQVIMISGMHDLGMAKEAMKMGAVDYMPKPIKLESLSEFLTREVKKLNGFSGSDKVESIMQNDDWN